VAVCLTEAALWALLFEFGLQRMLDGVEALIEARAISLSDLLPASCVHGTVAMSDHAPEGLSLFGPMRCPQPLLMTCDSAESPVRGHINPTST
jgi:hypothetical protein